MAQNLKTENILLTLKWNICPSLVGGTQGHSVCYKLTDIICDLDQWFEP